MLLLTNDKKERKGKKNYPPYRFSDWENCAWRPNAF